MVGRNGRGAYAAFSALRGFAREAPAEPEDAAGTGEVCELCGEPIPPDHRHLLEVRGRRMLCTCRACSVLFDRREASEGRYRLIPERRLFLEGFRMSDARWEGLRIPVEMAFFFYSTPAGRVVAFYPGPMGATESLLELGAWEELERENPVLEEMEEDVEALLVNRTGGAREHYLVPVDDCYRLVGLIRTRWRGLSGGREVWEGIRGFFERLRGEAIWVGARDR